MSIFSIFRRIKTVDGLIGYYKNYEDAFSWIAFNVRYDVRHFGSSWPTGDEVIRDRKASCNGFAVLAHEVFEKYGYFPRIVVYNWDAPEGVQSVDGKLHHAVCIVEIGSVWHCASNGVLTVCRTASSLVDAVREIEPDVLWAAEHDKEGGYIQTLISRI